MGLPPTVLQGLAIGAPIAGGFVESRAARQSAEASAQASEFNARMAERQGALEAGRIRREGKRVLGDARRQIAASGVTLSGSPMQFLLDQAFEVERSAFEAQLAARQTATLDRARASAERGRGRRESASALLTGATKALGSGLSLRRSGAF